MLKLRITGVTLSLSESEDLLKGKTAAIIGITEESVLSLRVIRKSLDARRRRKPRFVYSVDVSVPDVINLPFKKCRDVDIEVLTEKIKPQFRPAKIKPGKRPIVVGCGPAGLFAALTMSGRGIPPLLLERGKMISERITDVHSFWEKGILNLESHVHFGEGGAGTFSDGKLTSRAKNPYTEWVKKSFIDAGAPSQILTDAKPHIGTDRLRGVVVNLRKKLLELGCEVRFESKISDFLIHRDRVEGVIVNGSEEIKTDHLILASGQSAEDTYIKLYEHGVHLAPKPFAVGLRVEHPQELIDAVQYGKWRGHPDLPPADYFLTAKLADMSRSVYSFCMCPGGFVIGCSSEEGGVVTNGMSRYRRTSPYANSAVVVNVNIEDFGDIITNPLCGLGYRRHWEEKAFELGGQNYRAPAQRLIDFLRDRVGNLPGQTSFRPGVNSVSLREALPEFAVDALKRGIVSFDQKMRGFITEEATLIGVETRTSSPVRIVRGPDGQSLNVGGLYPCGEGAGYAGGIISSALDGIKVAEKVAV
ncbi:MAG TPA: NAD(P)/FAD-dependent oxidoreductase [Syntrophales bacterium]|nr:NAD(P)/FAD-dependent oxidoreductase [Syntrophales bacterium]